MKDRTPHLCRNALGTAIWVEVPAWMIWLFWHRIWKTDHKSSHGKEPEQ